MGAEEPHAGRAALVRLLEETYGARAPRLTPFYEQPEKAIYRVDHGDGAPWVLRQYPAARPLERLRGQAAIMRHLARHGVPMEQVIATTAGADTTVSGGRGVLVTSLISGAFPHRTPAVLRQLGESIGRLHALPPLPGDDPLLSRRAGAMPREDLAFGRACLARIAANVPAALRPAYDALCQALDATRDGEDLPPAAHGLLHSDCHLANARQTPDGGVAWFDWDGAGHGPRIAALGLLLYSCAVQAPGERRPCHRDLSRRRVALRVEALLDGYLRYSCPSPPELALLPDAIRFRPAVVAARELATAVERGLAPDDGGWWARYAAADLVAGCAGRILG